MSDKVHHDLVEWTVNYLKNKDLYLKNIEVIDKNKNGFDIYVKFKDREQFFIVNPIITEMDDVLSKFEPEKHFGLVVLNTLNNFESLLKYWDKLIKFKHLCIYFVNPFSKLDQRWIIYPYTHNNVCEKGVLEEGLRSMFDMVEPLTESSIKDTFK